MNQILYSIALSGISLLVFLGCGGLRGDEAVSDEQLACEALVGTLNLTLASAQLVEATDSTPQYCYVKGRISPAISYHVQLPLPENWNGRFLQWGDGGKDGDLDFADHRLAEGYAVANSNTGHDNGSEPGSSFVVTRVSRIHHSVSGVQSRALKHKYEPWQPNLKEAK